MSLYRKITNIIVGLIVGSSIILTGLYFYVKSDPKAQNFFFEAVLKSRLKLSTYEFGGDNLDIVFCGTGSPLASIDTAQQCIAVFAGDQMFIIDAGARADTQANNLKLPLGRLNGIFLTHYHSDHIAALGELHLQSWVRGRPEKLKVYGGTGIQQLVEGVNLMYGHDYKYRTDHHGEHILPSENAGLTAEIFTFTGNQGIVYEKDGLRVTAFLVDHSPIEPAFGFKIDYRGRSVVISGDTTANTAIATIAKHADVLIHEVLDPYMTSKIAEIQVELNNPGLGTILDDTLNYHTSPVEAAEIANQAEAKLLIFNHFVPPNLNFLTNAMFLRDAKLIRPDNIEMSYDGMLVRLPIGDKDKTSIINLR